MPFLFVVLVLVLVLVLVGTAENSTFHPDCFHAVKRRGTFPHRFRALKYVFQLRSLYSTPSYLRSSSAAMMNRMMSVMVTGFLLFFIQFNCFPSAGDFHYVI